MPFRYKKLTALEDKNAVKCNDLSEGNHKLAGASKAMNW